jgi:hypothetical protein
VRCKECFEKPFYPNAKCCFSCDHKAKFCNVLHLCGEDCSHWKPKNPDIVEVVRCKDCEHFGKNKEYRISKLSLSFCDKFHHNITRDNDFCSYGKRKEGAEK